MRLRRLFGDRHEKGLEIRIESRTGDMNEADRDMLDLLRKEGADLSQPRSVRAHLYFPSEEAAMKAADDLAAREWMVGLGQRDTQWLAQPERKMVVNETTFPGMNAELDAVASSHGGYYDRWEAAAAP
jgi:Regulator of ribonuclease activity B